MDNRVTSSARPLRQDALDDLKGKVAVPAYDRATLTPGIAHIGVGNFHRAHMAHYLDRLMSTGAARDWAIVGGGTRPTDAHMRALLAGQDWLTTVVELDPQGFAARVVGSMVDFAAPDAGALVARLADPAVRIVSMTVTEGGYYLNEDGVFDESHPDIQRNLAVGTAPNTVFGILIAALQARRAAGVAPFTVMSCDNLPENGATARGTVLGLAGSMDTDLAAWIGESVAFPNSMVDCITPRTGELQKTLVRDLFGIDDAAPVVCEPFRQWVLEDRFPNGRPPLEDVGVEFVSDVAPYELMKLRILNGGHAAIAYPSALLGYNFVHDAMADRDIRTWLDTLERREIIPLLAPLPGVDYAGYLETAGRRFANAAVEDTIPRLCQDGSNRQPKFILSSVRDALAAGSSLDGLALEVALWCRYCAGVSETGQSLNVEDDLVATLRPAAQASTAADPKFLGVTPVFGALGTAPRFVEAFASQLGRLQQHGVRQTLRAYADRT